MRLFRQVIVVTPEIPPPFDNAAHENTLGWSAQPSRSGRLAVWSVIQYSNRTQVKQLSRSICCVASPAVYEDTPTIRPDLPMSRRIRPTYITTPFFPSLFWRFLCAGRCESRLHRPQHECPRFQTPNRAFAAAGIQCCHHLRHRLGEFTETVLSPCIFTQTIYTPDGSLDARPWSCVPLFRGWPRQGTNKRLPSLSRHCNRAWVGFVSAGNFKRPSLQRPQSLLVLRG